MSKAQRLGSRGGTAGQLMQGEDSVLALGKKGEGEEEFPRS